MTEQLGSDRAFKWQWALPLIPIAASMFCLSALVYYHTAMGGAGTAWGFFQGAVVFLYRWMGFVPTFMFWLLLFVWCSIWFVTGRWENVRTRAMWMCAFTLCVAILVNLGATADGAPHSGLIGTYIAVRLTSVIGYAFAALLAVAASLASLLLATDFLFYRYFEALARGRATDEAGVEPEATNAFRELAFAGVYAEEPRVAPPVEAVVAPSRAAAEPPTVEEPFVEVARALDQDVVVRPRRRRRDEAVVPEAAHAAPEAAPAVTAMSPASASEFAIASDGTEPGDVSPSAAATADLGEVFDTVPADADRDAVVETSAAGVPSDNGSFAGALMGEGELDIDEREERVEEPAALEQLAELQQLDDAEVDDEPLFVIEAASTDLRDRGESGDSFESAGSAEPVVEIPRGTPQPREAALFPVPPRPRGDLDRAAREVLSAGRASITLLRRHLGCSPGEAIEMLDALRAAGVIDGAPGSPHGHVLTTLADWEAR